MNSTGRIIALALTLAAATAFTPAADWPQWGGPTRDFVVETAELARAWPRGGPPRRWERPLGPGYSAIVGDGERLYTMYRRGDAEVVVALAAADGRTLWEYAYDARIDLADDSLDTSHGEGPNATPLLAGERLVTLGFSGVVNCLRADTGEPIWSRSLQDLGIPTPTFGHSASPLRHRDSVVIIAGGALAFALEDGSMIWRNRDFEASYASPSLASVASRTVLVAAARGEIVALDPDDGTLHWRREHANQFKSILSSPVVVDGDRLFISAKWVGSRLLGLTGAGTKQGVDELWYSKATQIGPSNAVCRGNYLYASHGVTSHFLSATDLRSGRVAWRKRGFGQANLVRAGDTLVVLDFDGILALAEPDREGLKVYGRAAILDDPTWTPPTLVGTILYVRSQKTVVALELGLGSRAHKRPDRESRSAPSVK